MPKASELIEKSIKKYLFIGDSGTGKTTALWSLVRDGYKLRIYNFDNLLDPLIVKVRKECPDKLDNIEYMSFRDPLTVTDVGPIVSGTPKAFTESLKSFWRWEDGSNPADWGPEYVVVVDSLTTWGRSAYNWARGMAGLSGLPEGTLAKGVDNRATFFTAQRAIMNGIDALTAESFRANVIVIAHIVYLEKGTETKGFPLSVGTAIGPEIPTYFPYIVLATKTGSGDNVQRVLRTRSTQMIDLKDPRAFDPTFATELSIEDGLSRLFK